MRAIAFGLILGLGLCGGIPTMVDAEENAPERMTFRDEAFWNYWSDGQAELSGYELTYPRYGYLARGTAVTIFVKEDFSQDEGVKYDGRVESANVAPVMKLNLVQDFQTGIYDYNLLTSVFVALQPLATRSPGAPVKVSFSAQEWCGHVYSQARFIKDKVEFTSHSYFSGEADTTATLESPADGIAEDALFLWARGMAAPLLQPEAVRTVRALRSLETVRLLHQPAGWGDTTLVGASSPRTITVPAGEFEVDVFSVLTRPIGRQHTMPKDSVVGSWRFYVERKPPHRIIKWTAADGRVAELTGSTRLPYWELHGPGQERYLQELGLTPRPPRTP